MIFLHLKHTDHCAQDGFQLFDKFPQTGMVGLTITIEQLSAVLFNQYPSLPDFPWSGQIIARDA